MKSNFDVDSVEKNNIELLDYQVELILKSLEFYVHTYRFICSNKDIAEREEDDLRISAVTDTYEQILNEYGIAKKENRKIEKTYKNFA